MSPVVAFLQSLSSHERVGEKWNFTTDSGLNLKELPPTVTSNTAECTNEARVREKIAANVAGDMVKKLWVVHSTREKEHCEMNSVYKRVGEEEIIQIERGICATDSTQKWWLVKFFCYVVGLNNCP